MKTNDVSQRVEIDATSLSLVTLASFEISLDVTMVLAQRPITLVLMMINSCSYVY